MSAQTSARKSAQKSAEEKTRRRRERQAALTLWLASRSARNRTWVDKLCRRLVSRATAPRGEDFMRDPLIDEDEGFDPDELERYQRGQTR